MKCGGHDEITRRYVVFSWTPVWVRFLVFCGIGLLLRLLMRVRASLVIPLCARCNARWSAARSATVAGVVLLVGALVAARILGVSTLGRVIVLGAVAAIVLVRLVFVRPRVLQVHQPRREGDRVQGRGRRRRQGDPRGRASVRCSVGASPPYVRW